MRTAIIGALSRELAGVLKGWSRRQSSSSTIAIYEHDGAVAVCAGIGAARAALAVEAALATADVERLLSVGLAGGCDRNLRAGDVILCGTVIDVRSGERFAGDRGDAVLVTAPIIAGTAEKRRLHTSYGATAVDMEAATVARLARGHGLAFGAIKAISDEAEFAMESMNQFVTDQGQFRAVAFGMYAAMRPAMWSRVTRLMRNSVQAIDALGAAVHADLRLTEARGQVWK